MEEPYKLNQIDALKYAKQIEAKWSGDDEPRITVSRAEVIRNEGGNWKIKLTLKGEQATDEVERHEFLTDVLGDLPEEIENEHFELEFKGKERGVA